MLAVDLRLRVNDLSIDAVETLVNSRYPLKGGVTVKGIQECEEEKLLSIGKPTEEGADLLDSLEKIASHFKPTIKWQVRHGLMCRMGAAVLLTSLGRAVRLIRVVKEPNATRRNATRRNST